MENNLAKIDRIFRVIISICILLLFSFDIISGIVGGVLLTCSVGLTVSALLGFCPMYRLFGISTVNLKKT